MKSYVVSVIRDHDIVDFLAPTFVALECLTPIQQWLQMQYGNMLGRLVKATQTNANQRRRTN